MREHFAASFGVLAFSCAIQAADVTIEFPDGSISTIHGRATPRPRLVDEDGAPLWSIYVELRELAVRGDASAAWALGIALQHCGTPPREKAFCAGITESQAATGEEWTRRAALAGYPPASMHYASRLKFSNDALRYLEIAWNDGQFLAANNLAAWYERGSAGERKPDPVKALAFSFIADGITRHRLAGATTTLRITTREMSAEAHARRLAAASEEQRSEAIALARKLLQENPNCCYGF